jgi:hypothetical protein
MPCAVRAAARGSGRQTRRTVESVESEDGGVIEESREGRGSRVVRRRPARGSRGDGYAAAVAGGAMTAERAMLAVCAVIGGPGGRRLARSRIDSQRERRHQEEREQELR